MLWLFSPLLALFSVTTDEDDHFSWWGIGLFILALLALLVALVWAVGKGGFFQIWFTAFTAFWADIFKTIRSFLGMKG